MSSKGDWESVLEADGEKVERAEQILDGMETGDSFVLKPFTDFDGPVRQRGSGVDKFHMGVADAFTGLVGSESILNPGIISGRGSGFLLKQVEELGVSSVDVAGEMGAVYFLQEDLEPGSSPDVEDPRFAVPEDEVSKDGIYSFNLELFELLAENDLQLTYGDNVSNVVGSACVEAVGANLDDQRFSIDDTPYEVIYDGSNAQNMQQNIKLYADDETMDLFEFQNDAIRFQKNVDAAEALTNAFTRNPFIPWSFHDAGGEILMVPAYRADTDFDYSDFEQFVESATEAISDELGSNYWTSTYHDFSFDFGLEGYEGLKTRAAETITDQTITDQTVVPTNTGDKPTDVLQIEDSIFFAQEGTEAEQYCLENNVPYVPVKNTAESFYIQSELADDN